jgi:hypothetical protein
MSDHHLATARRHVREGAERIIRQEMIAAELDDCGIPGLATLAREVLEVMRSTFAVMVRHLESIERRSERSSPAARFPDAASAHAASCSAEGPAWMQLRRHPV